jgi:hypothetical protein
LIVDLNERHRRARSSRVVLDPRFPLEFIREAAGMRSQAAPAPEVFERLPCLARLQAERVHQSFVPAGQIVVMAVSAMGHLVLDIARGRFQYTEFITQAWFVVGSPWRPRCSWRSRSV